MILVMLGTQNNSFHRLLESIEKNIQNGTIQEEVIVQAGHTKFESKNMSMFDLIPKLELNNILQESRVIITHGGVGSIISALEKGKKVIAVPRLSKYNEHVNDHQKEIVEVFAKQGYIIKVDNVEDIGKAILTVESFEPKQYISNNEKMLGIIESFIDKF